MMQSQLKETVVKESSNALMKMRAAILVGQDVPLEVAKVEVPHLAVGQVLVRVEYSGICGKQLEELSGKRGSDSYIPHLLGHEGSGTVEETGPGVRKVKPGDSVVLHWVKGSGIDAQPASFRQNGRRINAGCVTTFSEYTVVSENRVTVIPKDFPKDLAALLGCAVTTGLGIVFNNLNLKPGQSIVIFGAGGVGLNVIQGALLVNAHPIVVIDLSDQKLEQALSFGATHTLHAGQTNILKVLTEFSGGVGFDGAVDLTGNNQVRETAYAATSDKGTTVFAGVPHTNDRITVDSFPLHFGRRVIGSHGGDTKPDVDIPRTIRLYRQGKLKLAEQISHRYGLEKVNEAMNTVRKGKAMRCLISMEGDTL
jgi:S-(hydroxymethyl)glutathione dehydrogenase / alcohol dehydrogenase